MENDDPSQNDDNNEQLPITSASSSLYPSVSTTVSLSQPPSTMGLTDVPATTTTSSSTGSSSNGFVKKNRPKKKTERKIYRVKRQPPPSSRSEDVVALAEEDDDDIRSPLRMLPKTTSKTRGSKGSSRSADDQRLYLEAQRQALEEVIGENEGVVDDYEQELLKKKMASSSMVSYRSKPRLSPTTSTATTVTASSNDHSSGPSASSSSRSRRTREESKSMSSRRDPRDSKAGNVLRMPLAKRIELDQKDKADNAVAAASTTVAHADESDEIPSTTTTQPGAIRMRPTITPPPPLLGLERGLLVRDNNENENDSFVNDASNDDDILSESAPFNTITESLLEQGGGGGTVPASAFPSYVVGQHSGGPAADGGDEVFADIYDDTKDKRRRRGLICLAALVVVVAVVLSVIYANRGDDDPVEVTTLSPSSSPSMQPSYSGGGILSILMEHSADGGKALTAPGSHQYEAAQWLQDHPGSGSQLLHNYTVARILQRYAMATMYFAMEGDLWRRKENWLDVTVEECDWYLELESPCNPETKLLSSFVLRENYLGGTLPPEVHLLSSLQVLDLSFGAIRGTLPTTLGLLSDNLQSLILSSNRISGTLPAEALSTMSSLQVLSLESNMLQCAATGADQEPLCPGLVVPGPARPPPGDLDGVPVPPQQVGAADVVSFGGDARINKPPTSSPVAYNGENSTLPPSGNGTGIPQPPPLPPPSGNGTDIQQPPPLPPPSGNGTDIQQPPPLPPPSGNGTNIQQPPPLPPPSEAPPLLNFPPVFSPPFGNLSNLQVLNVANNPLGQERGRYCGLTSNLGYLPSSLRELNLARTFIGGCFLPTEIGTLTNLRRFQPPRPIHEGGRFSLGLLPTEIGRLENLVTFLDPGTLVSTENYITIPSEIGQMTSLRKLDFPVVQNLIGTIPSEIGMLDKLVSLDFLTTGLDGTIPTEIGRMTHLTLLRMKLSSVSGTLPTELGLLTELRRLDFFKTKVEGTLPSEIGLLAKLTYLDLGHTDLTGKLPTEFGALTKLRFTGLIWTGLEGSIENVVGCHTPEQTWGSVMDDMVECSCCQAKCIPQHVVIVQNTTNGTITSTLPPEERYICHDANTYQDEEI